MMSVKSTLLTLGLTAALLGGPLVAGAAQAADHKVVFQVSDNDPGKWNLTLNNAFNVQKVLGKGDTDIEIVVYGPGINMLKMDSTVGNRIDQAEKAGIKVVACENTMHAQKLTKEDMLPEIGYVPGGVVEIMKLEGEGWAYIRP